MQYIAAANLPAGRGLSATKCEEFLLLTELCVASLYNYLSARAQPFPPLTVARIFFQGGSSKDEKSSERLSDTVLVWTFFDLGKALQSDTFLNLISHLSY